MKAFCPEHPKYDQIPKFTPLSETTSIPTPFIFGVLPPPGQETRQGRYSWRQKGKFCCPVTFETWYKTIDLGNLFITGNSCWCWPLSCPTVAGNLKWTLFKNPKIRVTVLKIINALQNRAIMRSKDMMSLYWYFNNFNKLHLYRKRQEQQMRISILVLQF